MGTMRRIAILVSSLLLACAAEDPPPGTVIGTFDFVATLEPEGACILEEVNGTPASFSFTAILSHEPETGKLWFRSGATEQSGTIDGSRFSVRTPAEGAGIPRSFNACTVARRQPCAFLLTEAIEAEILSDCPAEFAERAADDDADALPCPEPQEDGTLLWHNCACVRGRLEEAVRFEPVGEEICTCRGEEETEVFEGSCRLGYRLEAVKR